MTRLLESGWMPIGILLLICIIIIVGIGYNEYEEYDAPIQDEVVSIVDGVETHISTAGIYKQDELIKHIQSKNGKVISLAYPSDGLYGHSNSIMICWMMEEEE